MTVEEIFNKIATHMVEGLMYHDQFAKAYDFLGIYGYAQCHTYHYMEESVNYRKWTHYYATHYFKLVQLDKIDDPNLIPETWFKYTTMAVDSGTKRSAIKDLMSKWVEWEKQTKKLYQDMRQELCAISEVAAAHYLDKYIIDVTDELWHAEKKMLQLESTGYDMVHIIEQQEELYDKYKKKLRW